MTGDARLRFTICLVILLGYGHVFAEGGEGEPREVAGVAAESCSDRAGCIEGAVGESVAIILVGDDTTLEDDGTHPRLNVAEGDGVTDQDDEGAGAAIDVPGKPAGNVGSCDGRRFKKCR